MSGGCFKSDPHRAATCDLKSVDSSLKPFHLLFAERTNVDIALDKPHDIRCDHDSTRPRPLLHARGKVRRLADRGVVHVQIAADRTHNNLARVEPHSDADRDPLLATQPLGVPLH